MKCQRVKLIQVKQGLRLKHQCLCPRTVIQIILTMKLPDLVFFLRCSKITAPILLFFKGEQINIIPWSFHRVFLAQSKKIIEVLKNWQSCIPFKNKVWQEVCNVANWDTLSGSFTIDLQNLHLYTQETWTGEPKPDF